MNDITLEQIALTDTLPESHPKINGNFDKIQAALNNMELTKGIYGVMWDKNHAATEVTRIGDMPLHASLPVQSKMRRCVLADDGTVNYYLHPTDSTKREDGSTAVLDGSHGQVMVEIPAHWARFRQDGNNRSAMISIAPFEGAFFVPKMYVSAYKAALDRDNNKLSSVVNTSASFRGGNNSSSYDGTTASLIGKPVTAIDRIQFRDYAQNRGVNWYDMDYMVRKTVYWLITIEYANRHHQTAFNSNLTAEGYKQGGLGTGPTDLSGSDWSSFNGYYPLFECGLTNSLGNQTGEIPVTLADFPSAGLAAQTQVFSYRGVENFFGDIWEWTNGINIKNENSSSKAYIATSQKKSDDDYIGYELMGNMPTSNGYISEIQFGERGDILPKSTSGASSSTHYADYYYQNADTDALKGLRFGGAANSGSAAGSAYSYSGNAPSTAYAYIGSRLAFLGR